MLLDLVVNPSIPIGRPVQDPVIAFIDVIRAPLYIPPIDTVHQLLENDVSLLAFNPSLYGTPSIVSSDVRNYYICQ